MGDRSEQQSIDNIERHGPIDQTKPKEKQLRSDSEPPAKESVKCHALVAYGCANCLECGHPFPPPDREAHDTQASEAGALSSEVTYTEYDVQDVVYRIHQKRDSDEDASRCLRVDYMIGLNHWQVEFICVEHSGYARRKAEAWWREWQRDEGAEMKIERCPMKIERCPMKIERCPIDANWGRSANVVYQFCQQSPHSSILLPFHGRSVAASSNPFSEYKRLPGDRVGFS